MTETKRLGRPPTGRDTVQVNVRILRENRDWLRQHTVNPGALLDRLIEGYRARHEAQETEE